MYKKIIWWAVGIVVVLGLVWFFWPTTKVEATVVLPTCGTETYEFNNEGSNSRVSVNVHGFDQEVDVTGLNGWSVSNLWLDQVGGGTN